MSDRKRVETTGIGFKKFWGEEPPDDKRIADDIRNLFNYCNPHCIFWSPLDYHECPMCYIHPTHRWVDSGKQE